MKTGTKRLLILISFTHLFLGAVPSQGEELQNIQNLLSWDKKEVVLNSHDGVMFAPGSMQLPEQTFTVKNISDTDITIKDVVGDCTCLDIKKDPKTIKPGESWSFSLDIKIPKYGVERDITFIVSTDKGNDQLRLLVKSKDFATPSATELKWDLNDNDPKRILFTTEQEILNVSDVKILGDGFKVEVLEGLKGVPILEITPIKEGFDRGMLKFNIKNDYHQEALSVKLQKESE